MHFPCVRAAERQPAVAGCDGQMRIVAKRGVGSSLAVFGKDARPLGGEAIEADGAERRGQAVEVVCNSLDRSNHHIDQPMCSCTGAEKVCRKTLLEKKYG